MQLRKLGTDETSCIWVDSVDFVSPIFACEEDAVEWYSRMQKHFCPNKNCHVKTFNTSEILENGWLSSM